MGSNLLNTIEAITLGTLDTLYYTVSLLKQKHLTGGVSMYTVTHYDTNGFDLRSSNLKNNFQGGNTLRVEKSNIKSTNAYKFAEQENLERPTIDTPGWIGRLYHLPDTVLNPIRNFITEEGFGNFEFLLRKRNTNYKTVGQKYSSISTASIVSHDYESDPLLNAKEQNTARMLTNTEYGSEYFVGEISRSLLLHSELKKHSEPFRNSLKSLTQYIDDKLGILARNSSTYFNLNPENTLANTFDISTTHLDRIYSKELEYKQPTIVGNLMRGEYSYLRNYSFNEYVQGGKAKYGDEIDVSNPYIHAGRIKMTPDGIFDYYSGRREDIIGTGFYSYNRGYVFGDEGDKIEKYYVNDGMHPEDDIKIQRGNEGNLLSMYYSEHDNGKPAGIIKHSEIESFTMVEEGVSNVSVLIRKTNELFENCKISSMVNRFHSYDLHKDDELVTSRSDKYGISRGRNLLKANDAVDDESGYENPYCRVWTKHHQYSKLSRRIRPFYGEKEPMKLSAIQNWYGETMRPNGGGERLGNFSVLKDNGFVKISSEHNGGTSTDSGDIKKYMFSIENLAWRDIDLDGAKISKEQQGPNKGRIMWFPPYNLKFTENVNVDWNAAKFIGRGEQIYTYVNTDRSGTLSFTMLIDHPSLINKWRGTSLEVEEIDKREDDLLRFFAGCGTLEGRLDDGANRTEITGGKATNNKKLGSRSKDVALIVFFPNNFSGHYDNVSEGLEKLRDYECANGVTCDYTDDDMSEQILHEGNYINNSIAGLNNGTYDLSIKTLIELSVFNGQDDGFEFYSIFDPQHGISNLNSLITEDEIFGDKFEDIHIDSIDVYGCASSHGRKENNIKLEERRAEFLKNAIIMNCNSVSEESFNRPFQKAEIPANDLDPSNPDVNKIDAKIGRCAYAIFHVSWNEATTTTAEQYEDETININEDVIEGYGLENSAEEQLNEYVSTSTEIVDDYSSDNEYLYFSEIDYDDVAYQRIINKVRYFNPAFHSVTPEGFNARLTFLHQCTRQGPTIDLSSGRVNTGSSDMLKYAGNLAFGRPPYCILRIGDFFHTKICITSISIDYDSGSGIQWDLNPEGVGVQPMYANINMNFNFIGGQDIAGPIERLQNAVTSNYYANASIYDNKADVKGQSMYDVTVNVPKKEVGKNGNATDEDVNGVYETDINDRVEKGFSDLYKNSIKGYKK